MEVYDTKNVFAKILRNEMPCKKLFENNHALAFYDINPKAPIHVIIIPKGAYCSYIDFFQKASMEEMKGLGEAIKNVEKYFDISSKGSRLITNQGTDGKQEIPHFHIHFVAGKPLCSDLSV